MTLTETQKTFLKITGTIMAGAVLYKMFAKKRTPMEAVQETITEPLAVVADTTSQVLHAVAEVPSKMGHLVKGSKEAKEYMRNISAKRRPLKAFVCVTCKKGHTSRDPKEDTCKGCKNKKSKKGILQTVTSPAPSVAVEEKKIEAEVKKEEVK